jgi:DNA-directed RNA polymerase specialized sigma54-like protein
MAEDTLLKLSQQLVMTPQLQMAIRLLATPTTELFAMVATWRAEHPGAVDELAVGEIDPYDAVELESAADDERPPWLFVDEEPLPPLGGPPIDAWVFGNPPQVRANPRAFPRLKIVSDDRDAKREAAWLVRSLRQRAKTYEAVVRAAVELRPAVAISLAPDKLEPMTVRAIAEVVGMHESTITRVVSSCRFQTMHGAITFVHKRGKLAFSPV